MKSILQKEAPVLREIAETVAVSHICTPKIKKIIKEMKVALASQDDGVAIAAPQIGYSVRIFIVAGKALTIGKKFKKDTPVPDTEKELVFINPVLTKLSKEKKEMEEGCLSVRYLYGNVMRSTKATVEAYDENGKKVVVGASGLLAQIFQHEMDHLNGILFIDKAKHIEEVLPQEITPDE